MKRKFAGTLVVALGLFGAAAAYVGQAKVPPEAIRTETLLDRAWNLPVAETFGRDVKWQSNGSVCGPASLANVLRSLGEQADTEAEIIEGAASCWFHICPVGLTLDQTAELVSTHTNRKVMILRDLTPEGFREILRDTNNPDRRYVINFSREPIFGAGVGHFSPIGGSLEECGPRLRARCQRGLPALAD